MIIFRSTLNYNVVGMAEQISKKHRHKVIMLSKCYTDLGAMTSVQQIMVAKQWLGH